MTSRTAAVIVGVLTLALGLFGLLSPARTLAMVGFAPLVPTEPAPALGEARAVYGGLFTVLGAFTLWGALDPAGKRPFLLMAGLLWLGVFAGRALGASLDGNPGVAGWIALAFEGTMSAVVLWSALATPPRAPTAAS
jgi:drug/metabolite transporter superfamily protein YnfA